MRKSLTIKNKRYPLPIFLPDATQAVTRSLDSYDLKKIKVKGVVVNTYHLLSQPGMKVLKKAGGIKNFMNFDGLVVSDSGGWQVFSLIHRKKGRGKITDQGVFFPIGKNRHKLFSPEESIQTQFDIGSDIMICLDDFTDPQADKKQIKKSIERTILWAKKSKQEFERQIKRRKLTSQNRPHLFAVIQGGWDKQLRKYCAEELLKIGFDGYGYGGYTVNDKNEQDIKLAKYVAELIPDGYPKFALGSGKLSDIIRLNEVGWDIFDCVLPTRDARHQRLYAFKKNPQEKSIFKKKEFYQNLYIKKGKYANDLKPISKFCDCPTCQNYSRAYLRHLFKIGDFTAFRLASLHNLRAYTQTINILKNQKKSKNS